ncbi:hypothetical protein HanRHA438_Chr12g0534491 [Helianthus annuus]|nr:hypothetical protein HanRHA438_Chr12g0534491 [Helianthus annuus]
MCKAYEGKIVIPSQIIYSPFISQKQNHLLQTLIPNNNFRNPRINPKLPFIS